MYRRFKSLFKYTKKVGPLFLASLLLVSAVAGPIGVLADATLIPDPNTINTVTGNSFYAELSDERPGSALQANQAYAMLSYTTSASRSFRIGYCTPTTNSYCTKNTPAEDRNDMQIIVCALEVSPTSKLKEPQYRIKGNDNINCQTFNQPASGVNHNITVSASLADINKRYNYMVLAQFYGSPDLATNGAIPFKIRAVDGGTPRVGFFPYQRMDQKGTTGTTGNLTDFYVNDDAYMAIQNRRATQNYADTTWVDSVSLFMRTDCLIKPQNTVAEGSNIPGFQIKWHDADAQPGSIPDNSNPEIFWTLKNITKGNSIHSSTRAFWTGKTPRDYLGGQAERRADVIPWASSASAGYGTFYYEAGDVLEWRWDNVLANNGINLQVPFDDVNVNGECPPKLNSARCNVTGVPDTIAPGETKDVEIKLRNGNYGSNIATNPWTVAEGYKLASGVYPVPANQDADSNGVYIDSKFWKASQIPGQNSVENQNRVLLTQTVYPENLASSTQQTEATFRFRITAPTDKTGEHQFVWQMSQAGVERFGEVCIKPIKIVADKPYVQAAGADVYAGIRFRAAGQCDLAHTSNAGIRTWQSDPNSGLDLRGGAGSQYGTFATGVIPIGGDYGFTSANGFRVTDSSRLNRYVASFTNGGNATSSYGSFDSTGPCVEDITNRASSTTVAPADVNSYLSGLVPSSKTRYVKLTAGTISLYGTTVVVPNGVRVVFIATGDIQINGSIVYESRGTSGTAGMNPNNVSAIAAVASSKDNQPFFAIVTSPGYSISMHNHVLQLDGVYVAEPLKSGSQIVGGVIDTCSTNSTNCSARPLIINGSLIAQKIKLNRSYGSMGDGSTFPGPFPTCTTGSNGSDLGGAFTVQKLIARQRSCAAELDWFSQSAYLTDFYAEDAYANTTLGGVISTQELPPIY